MNVVTQQEDAIARGSDERETGKKDDTAWPTPLKKKDKELRPSLVGSDVTYEATVVPHRGEA